MGAKIIGIPPLPLILPHYRVAECATEFPPVQPMTITLFIFGTTPTCYQLINVYNLYPAQAGWAAIDMSYRLFYGP